MQNEQETRFEDMRRLVDEAKQAMSRLTEITDNKLIEVNNDSSDQAEQLQRIQQTAGTVVHAVTQVSEIARHARSYQAQAHDGHRADIPH